MGYFFGIELRVFKSNLYNYDKKKGYIPLDNKGEPIFKTKKDYKICINSILVLLGLENITKRCSIEHYVYADPNDPLNQYGLGSKIRKDIKYTRNTNRVKWNKTNYIFVKIRDESKLTWQNVFRTLKIKKIHKPLFISQYNLSKHTSRYVQTKLLAIPVSNNLDVDFLNYKLTKIFKNNVQIVSEFNYPFNFNMAISNAFTNELLDLYQVFEVIQNHKSLNIMNVVNEINQYKSIFFRNGLNYNSVNEEWINVRPDSDWGEDWGNPDFIKWYEDKSANEPELIDERNQVYNFSFKYKKSWIINGYDEFKEKLYIIIPNLLNNSNIDKHMSIDISRKQCWLIIKSFLIKYHKNKDVSYWDLPLSKRLSVDNTLNKYNYIYEWCFNNQKDLSLKQQRLISNIDRLTNAEKVFIDTLLVNKVFNETNTYKKESCQKSYKIFLSRFIKEVYGKIKFELEYNNKDYIHDKYANLEYKLDKHIKGIHISNKEFNLIIDELKLIYKGFNITPSSNIKYKLLKAMELDINEEFDFELYGKSIINVKSNFLKDIFYKLIDKLCNNLSNNFIIISVKKLLGLISDETFKSIILARNHYYKPPPNISLT